MSKIAHSVALIILDGFGLAPEGPGNAVALANTPTFDQLWANHPKSQLTACGLAVGLPEGQMGNSEVGHLNLGAGSVIKQDLVRIDESVDNHTLGQIPQIEQIFDSVKASNGKLHLAGLVSDGGVHSSMRHLQELIGCATEAGISEVLIHAFTDGRDTLPKSGAGFISQVEEWANAASQESATQVRIATVIGRYYAMDRDSRWERVQLAYDLVSGHGSLHQAVSASEAVAQAYERGETDEFVGATVIGDSAPISPDDAVIIFNFRPDRVREITQALAVQEFSEVDRHGLPPISTDRYLCFTQYNEQWDFPIAFPPNNPEVTLAEVISGAGHKQVHVAETEKYPHVTYFFNGGVESQYPGEFRKVVQSPRDVATYDLKPEMSAREAADAFIELWQSEQPAFGILNFANPDMVGHTGSIPAAIKAIEFVDSCLADVLKAVQASGGVALVTADHGNADYMLEPDGSPNTAHTLNPVPFVLTDADYALRDQGVLADVAPTVLQLLGISQPEAMTGNSMLNLV